MKQNKKFAIIFCVGIAFIIIYFLLRIPHMNENELVVPAIEYVLENGYPTNEAGETYGPAIKVADAEEPDLILVELKNGLQGYVKKTDLDSIVSKPGESSSIPIYLQDGKTQIGSFRVS